MPNLTDLEIRNAILDTIRPQTSDAILLNRWVLGLGLGESIPYMKVPLENKIHGYMVSRSGVTREKAHINSQSFKDTYKYKLWGFHSFIVGNNDSNSEDTFSQEINDVQMALAESPRLTFDSEDTNLVETTDWQIEEIDVYDFGSHKVHVAQGTLDVIVRIQANAS